MHVEQVPHDRADRVRAGARVVHQRRAVLLIELHEPFDLLLDRVELRQDRLGQIVVVGAEPVVRRARPVPSCRRSASRSARPPRLVAAADLLHAQPVLLHRVHERRQLRRDVRRIDVAGIRLHRRLQAAAGHLDRRFRDFVGRSEPVEGRV